MAQDNIEAGLSTIFAGMAKAWTGAAIQSHGSIYLDSAAAL